ncbi:lipopolysaccharide biosynthesis protein [Chitinophaga vietnamensis]|uniref:lipopolysaccharide biosynthesis protein n=1 Tax=Chitinophaga vietnamensis TaxID=2593957 RepID=UPI001375F0C4|nr:lipopolysaccharide biosynthesis protein [Chitinophaga vietnamensis]
MGFRLLSVVRNHHFQSLLGNVISAFFNVLSFAVLVRILPAGDFGEWVLFMGTFNIIDQVRTALLQSGLIRFYAGTDPGKARQVCGAAWYVAIALTVVTLAINGIVLLAGFHFFNATWIFLLSHIGILFLLALPLNFASWLLQARHLFDKIVHIRLIQNSSFLLFLLALHLLHRVSIPTVLYAYCLAQLATSLYCMAQGWTELRSIFFKTKEQVHALFVYGRLIVGSMLSSGLITYSDNFLIRTMINPAAVAIYSIPQKFMEVIEIILRSFVATAQPTLSAAVNRNDWPAVARAFCRYTGAVTIIILPFIIGLIILIQPLIIILAKKNYLDATPLVLIFLCSAIFYPIDRFTGVTLDMINKPQVNFYKNLVKVSINIVGDILFIWMFMDLRAVAAVSFLNLLAGVAFGYFFLKRYVRFTVTDILKQGWAECRNMTGKLSLKLQLVKK